MAALSLCGLLDSLATEPQVLEGLNLNSRKFELDSIIGHRTGPRTLCDYKVRWKPTIMKITCILAGIIDGKPIYQDIEKLCPVPGHSYQFEVVWKETWVDASCILQCGDLLHAF